MDLVLVGSTDKLFTSFGLIFIRSHPLCWGLGSVVMTCSINFQLVTLDRFYRAQCLDILLECKLKTRYIYFSPVSETGSFCTEGNFTIGRDKSQSPLYSRLLNRKAWQWALEKRTEKRLNQKIYFGNAFTLIKWTVIYSLQRKQWNSSTNKFWRRKKLQDWAKALSWNILLWCYKIGGPMNRCT